MFMSAKLYRYLGELISELVSEQMSCTFRSGFGTFLTWFCTCFVTCIVMIFASEIKREDLLWMSICNNAKRVFLIYEFGFR